MITHPSHRYRASAPVQLSDRQWPNIRLHQAPVWSSTDLRDGNQSLFEPMGIEKKLQLFQCLCARGFKEIEVGFPSASQVEYDFVRLLIEKNMIPDDVRIAVLTPARDVLIHRTMQSLQGASRALIHLYTATSEIFREHVLGLSAPMLLEMTVASVRLIKGLVPVQAAWGLEYSPEMFSSTELVYVLKVCDAVTDAWGATQDRQVVINLPATVEVSTPNIYADQIEWMHRHLARRDAIVLSVHPHNDRGTAVAAAELALMAGAERVEGCLFGQGERTGNVDLVTLALNLYTQGVPPGLDFSELAALARTMELLTQMPVHPRHPYAGDLVFTAFSGSHQDAIAKGMKRQGAQQFWEVPYLPLDPAELGRNYESIIRVNSQSGKGGIAHLLFTNYGLVLPRRAQIEFSAVVQSHMDQYGGEVVAATLWSLFEKTYLQPSPTWEYLAHSYDSGGMELRLRQEQRVMILSGKGRGPLEAAAAALSSAGYELRIHSYEERSLDSRSQGVKAKACAWVEASSTSNEHFQFGAGIDDDLLTAAIRALVSACGRLYQISDETTSSISCSEAGLHI
ncbi:MAG: 2-isopropylmalate synthase [Pseudomonadales bacterium]|nr:2-isopropylmalate synthase [Pseudomonadales bacterium]